MKRIGILKTCMLALAVLLLLGISAMAEGKVVSPSGNEQNAERYFDGQLPSVQSSAPQDSLAGAMYDERNDNCLFLDLRAIANEYGITEVHVFMRSSSDAYKELEAQETGVIEIPSGQKTYIYITDGEDGTRSHVVWAGAYSGDYGDLPEGILWVDQVTSTREDLKGSEGQLLLDVSSILTGNCSAVRVWETHDANGYVELKLDAEGKTAVSPKQDNVFLSIEGKLSGLDEWVYLWAGEISAQDDVSIMSFRFCPEVASTGEKDLPDITHLGANDYEQNDIVSITEQPVTENNQSTLPQEQSEIHHEASLLLNVSNDSVLYTDGSALLSGQVVSDDLQTESSEIEIYVNGVSVQHVNWDVVSPGRYNYTIVDLCIPQATTQLEVFAQFTNEPESKSEIVMMEVDSLKQGIKVPLKGYSGVYDGGQHSIDIDVENVPDGTTITFAACDSKEKEPESEQWTNTQPQYKNAGTSYVCVKVEKEGYIIEYSGEAEVSDKGYAWVTVQIEPSPIVLELSLHQKGQAVYSGEAQSLVGQVDILLKEDGSGLFDVETIKQDPRWGQNSILQTEEINAGEYYLKPEKELFAFIESFDPNFRITAEWVESALTIAQKPIILESASKAIVYGSQKKPLTADDPIQGTRDIIETDYFSGNVIAVGEQEDAGIGINSIDIQGAFAEKQANYDIEKREGVLVVFPQSINDQDIHWSDVEATIDTVAYSEDGTMPLPAYYNGMRVELEQNDVDYSGSAQEIRIQFKDAEGNSLQLHEGEDYYVEYFRGEEVTDDLTNAGAITVRINGIGNYAGVVERSFVVNPIQLLDVSIEMENWVYDGNPASSGEHIPQNDYPGARYLYYDAEGTEIAPPINIGIYSMQAVWDSDDCNYRGMSQPCSFEIEPASVKVKVIDGGIEIVADETGLFREDMVSCTNGVYTCSDDNYVVDFDLSDSGLTASIDIENWSYDGTAANSANHPIHVFGFAEEPEYHYYDVNGEEIEAPQDVGEYTVVAMLTNAEDSIQQTFLIAPAPLTIKTINAEKVFGDADPEFLVEAEGLIGKDSIEWTTNREPGENVGTYDIQVSNRTDLGNYMIPSESIGVLVIKPRLISEGNEIKIEKGEAVVYDEDGNQLEPGRDFVVEREEDPADPRKVSFDVLGRGNYTGSVVLNYEVNLAAKLMSSNFLPLVCIAIGLILLALVSMVVSIRLSKRAKKERYKLLDSTSRKSNRTLRHD